MSSFMEYREGALPQAIVISGAGTQEANGIYRASEKEYCNAPIYEHMELGADLKITREPHTNPKTGQTKHGWLLGQRKTPIYGAPTESLMVPSVGWKKFNGAPPVPTVKVHEQLVDVFYTLADDAKCTGDTAGEKDEWQAACEAYTSGIDALKRSGERFGDAFKNRAALLLSRRANAHAKMQDWKAAFRDAIAALELVRSLASAEVTALEAAKQLGCKDDTAAARILEEVGFGRVLDPGAPLVLRCVERWIDEVLAVVKAGGDMASLPAATHQQADRYLDGVDEQTRQEVIKRYLPDANKPLGGTGIIHNAEECLTLMKKWEEVLASRDFQLKRAALWDRTGLSYPVRLREQKILVAETVTGVLQPLGFAPGRPGLSRAVKQMQVYWSKDRDCARKALELEELADVSLADLE